MYNHYKPLRNYLRSFDLWTGLGATYFYMQHLQFEKQLPEQLSTPATRAGKSKFEAGLFEHVVELLARELILNGQLRGGKPFSNAHVAFKAMGMIHKLEDKFWGEHDSRSQDIMLQLSRIAFKQFPWQNPITNGALSRYYMLYSFPPVAAMIEAEFGMTCGELFQIILLLMEEMLHVPTPAFAFLPTAAPSIQDPIDALRSRISISATELRELMIERQSFDINWAYSFNPLRKFPLVHAGNPLSTICPAPPILVQRLTDGLYFDLIRSDKRFGDAIGHAFEGYVGKVAQKLSDERTTLLQETSWGKPEKRSVDWIIEDDSGTLFVECKLARLDIASQTEISPEPAFLRAINRLAENIGQLYSTLADALGGKYPHWQCDGRPVHPAIVTFYNWFAFGPFFYKHLDALVAKEFEKRCLDYDLLNRHPFFVCSIDEFEGLLTACSAHNVDEVVAKKQSPRHRQSIMRGFLAEEYPGSISNAWGAFEEGLDSVIDGPSRITRWG